MAKVKSTTPKKPRPDFPLFPHKSGYWAKKVRGRFHYFGKIVDDPKGQKALDKWLDQKDDLLAGRTPRATGEGLSVRDLCNRFLTAKRGKMEVGELTPVSFADYHSACKRIVQAFGPRRLVVDLDASDFESFRRKLAKGWGPVTLANEIRRIRVVFNYAVQNNLIPQNVRYGSEFKPPSRRVLRRNRQAKHPRMFEASDLRKILDAANTQLKTMVLLGINAALGNSDIANLPTKAVNLKTGWLDYPRPKTGIPRRCPLWPETTAAIRETLDNRPKSKRREHAGLLFITRCGSPWGTREIHEDEKGNVKKKTDDPVSKEFTKLLKSLKMHKPGLGFYSLRHSFATIGGDARDQVAVNSIMGHADESMAAAYRERVDDSRLLAVTEHVRQWLFDTKEKQ